MCKKDLKLKLKIVFCVVDFSPFIFDLVNIYPKCPLSIRITDLIKVVEIKVYKQIKRLNHFLSVQKNKYYQN